MIFKKEFWFPKIEAPSKPEPIKSKTPWMDWMYDPRRLNKHETDPAFVKLMVPGWKYTNVPSYDKIAGNYYAWCAMTVNFALFSTGFKGNKRADAKSFRTYGTPCDYVYGAILQTHHAKGGDHVTFFVRWKDKEKRIAICIGGNQNNRLQESEYNLSGNRYGHDEVMGGPRWPVV